MPIERIAAEWLPARLAVPALSGAARVHFVAHSMGTLLVRHLLAHARPLNLGRSVFIGPPSRGAALADAGRPRWLFRLAVGLNLRALGESPDAFWRSLPQSVDYPVGIIVGTGHGNPWGLSLDGPNDGTVTVESTRLDGATDSIELPSAHTMILFRRRTADQVVSFLRTGAFAPNGPAAES